LRLDRRGPRDRHARQVLRVAVATALAVPVVGLIIGESLARRLGPSRPALLIVGLLVGTAAISALSTVPTGARYSITPAPIVAREFVAIPSPVPTARATGSVGGSLAESQDESPELTPAPEVPVVMRFRPRDGWLGVSQFAAVSVRFSRPMDHVSTEEAFGVVVGETPITGTFRWAEGDTVLVLTPARALPYGARIALSVDVGARTADGVALAEARSVTFTVRQRPAPSVRRARSVRPAPTVRPAPRSSGWRWPLLGPITQRFGESLTKYGFHQGIDINGETGDPVRAARRGRVVVAGAYDRCGGLQVHIDHGDGIASWYRHLSRINVAKGTLVEAGTVIGRVGDTGCSFGSHLHFAIRKGSTFVDPLRYLPTR
jgi:murein DD-endopeptidase MepM/ murein hydrolase activator NlpD